MKTNNILWAIVIIVFLGTAFAAGYSIKEGMQPDYSQQDSIKLDSLEHEIVKADSIIKFHKTNAENLILEKNGLKKSNFILSEKLRKILVNPAAKCEDKLELSLFLNDSLKLELNKCDSAYIEVDKECENYALQVENYKDKNDIVLKRNLALSDSVSSLHVFYADSLTAQTERSDKAIKKEKGKTLVAKIGLTVVTAFGIYGTIK